MVFERKDENIKVEFSDTLKIEQNRQKDRICFGCARLRLTQNQPDMAQRDLNKVYSLKNENKREKEKKLHAVSNFSR